MEIIPSVFLIAFRNLQRVGVLDEAAQFHNGAYSGNVTTGAIRWHDHSAISALIDDIENSLRSFAQRVPDECSELDDMDENARASLFRKATALGLYPHAQKYRIDLCDFRPLRRRDTAYVLIDLPLNGEKFTAALKRLIGRS